MKKEEDKEKKRIEDVEEGKKRKKVAEDLLGLVVVLDGIVEAVALHGIVDDDEVLTEEVQVVIKAYLDFWLQEKILEIPARKVGILICLKKPQTHFFKKTFDLF